MCPLFFAALKIIKLLVFFLKFNILNLSYVNQKFLYVENINIDGKLHKVCIFKNDFSNGNTPHFQAFKVDEKSNEKVSLNTIYRVLKENKELVESRKNQMAKVSEMLKKDIELELHVLPESVLPEDVTAKQINTIINIIE